MTLIRTDLAAEFSARSYVSGMAVRHLRVPYPVTEVAITTEDAANVLGKPCGRYFTVEGLNFSLPFEDFEQTIGFLRPLFMQLVPKQIKSALVIGLGNREITPDCLGPNAVSQVLVTRHLSDTPPFEKLTKTAALAPGVLGQTGIEAAALCKAVCDFIKPDVVFVIDALAAAEKERLCTSLQFSDVGIVPGSGVANHRSELSEKTLHVPVISIGVPTVIAMDEMPELFVTPREVDVCMEHAGKFIGQLINAALYPNLSMADLMAITGR